MNFIFMFMIGFYAIIFLMCVITTVFKVRERIKEKPKDDSDLNRFDKY